MDSYPVGFEDDDRLRSSFVRDLTLRQLNRSSDVCSEISVSPRQIPRTLIRYWHDESEVPDDVQACLNSWDRLGEDGFEFRMFSDLSAAKYIAHRYGAEEREAFARCRHPAMRCDYLRMCVLFAEGGFYVDADEVLIGESWTYIFHDGALKVQPLCYDIPSGKMLPPAEIWRMDLPTNERIFYVNNNPIAAPAGHPILLRAIARATEKLLGKDRSPEIQSTTGPGNFTAALVAHAREMTIAGVPLDFELLQGWEHISETRWELSYRGDSRNWRNMGAS